MLTDDQKTWLNQLNGNDSIKVIPYDSKVESVFKIIKAELIGILGKVAVCHRGSTALKISGQGEIDLYLPVAKKNFNSYLDKLKRHLGEPGSVYELRRVRFVKYIDGVKVEIFIINRNGVDWKNSVKFEKYLRQHPEALRAYEKLKVDNANRSTRDYYTKKVEFINKTLAR